MDDFSTLRWTIPLSPLNLLPRRHLGTSFDSVNQVTLFPFLSGIGLTGSALVQTLSHRRTSCMLLAANTNLPLLVVFRVFPRVRYSGSCFFIIYTLTQGHFIAHHELAVIPVTHTVSTEPCMVSTTCHFLKLSANKSRMKFQLLTVRDASVLRV